jgi:hypothetical protein
VHVALLSPSPLLLSDGLQLLSLPHAHVPLRLLHTYLPTAGPLPFPLPYSPQAPRTPPPNYLLPRAHSPTPPDPPPPPPHTLPTFSKASATIMATAGWKWMSATSGTSYLGGGGVNQRRSKGNKSRAAPRQDGPGGAAAAAATAAATAAAGCCRRQPHSRPGWAAANTLLHGSHTARWSTPRPSSTRAPAATGAANGCPRAARQAAKENHRRHQPLLMRALVRGRGGWQVLPTRPQLALPALLRKVQGLGHVMPWAPAGAAATAAIAVGTAA